MESWDPFCEGPASVEDGQAMENWNPFEDPEMLELTGELAMESDDIEGLEAWLVQAKVMQLPWEKIQPKQEKLELLRSQKVPSPAANREAKDTEEIKAVAQQKLLRKRLVPSLDLELSQQEEAILQKDLKENIAPKKSQEVKVIQFPVRVIFPDGIVEELKVNPCENGSNILLQLLPLKRSHVFPEDFAVLLPSGKALDFRKPLQAQGVHGNAELRIDEACFVEEVDEVPSREESEEGNKSEEENFAREVEQGWNLIYWPLCVALAGFEETLRAIQKHPQVVVFGWNACHDLEVMQLTQEVSYKIGSDYLIVTGSQAPPEEWWPTTEEEANLAASECTLRGSRGPKHPKTSVLRIDQNGVPSELAPAILAGLRAAGCGSSLALVVVCRAFQSRRPVSVLHWCLQQEDYSHWRITVLPYSWDPRFVYLEDCQHRGDQVILEAQLLTEMNPTVWMEEEGQEAEIALSRVLLAHPQPERAHWHNGFYSKPFKERTRLARDGVAEHCEWFRWQKSTPLSAESHAKAAATRSQVQAPLPEDDEEPPPLVSHE